MIFEKLPRESAKSFAAFRCYLDMGYDRSLSAVAAKLGKSTWTMEKLSRKYDWQGRVAARDVYLADLERQAIERVAIEQAVDWWKSHEPIRRLAWQKAEKVLAMVDTAIERWEKSGRTPGFEGMARMLDLAFKLKQFAAGMPSEIKEVHNLHAGKVSIEWEEAIRKAYQVEPGPNSPAEPAGKTETIIDVQEVKP